MSRTASYRRSERGFTLAALLTILGVIMIFVTATVPRQWSMVMARERDKQTIFVMKQYARAIRNFQLKHGSAPVSLDQLKEARTPRMIRGNGEWVDPLTGEVDWIPVLATQQQQQIPGSFRNPQAYQPNRQGQAPPTGAAPGPNQSGGVSGPLAGVRPNKSGKSFLTLNGADTYETWSYTVQDLEQEITGRRAALATK